MAEPDIRISTDATVDDSQNNIKETVAAQRPVVECQPQGLLSGQFQQRHTQGIPLPQVPIQPTTSNWGKSSASGNQQHPYPQPYQQPYHQQQQPYQPQQPYPQHSQQSYHPQPLPQPDWVDSLKESTVKETTSAISKFFNVPNFKDFPALLALGVFWVLFYFPAWNKDAGLTFVGAGLALVLAIRARYYATAKEITPDHLSKSSDKLSRLREKRLEAFYRGRLNRFRQMAWGAQFGIFSVFLYDLIKIFSN